MSRTKKLVEKMVAEIALKPLPADIEHLYRDKFQLKNGLTKTVDYYQVDRTADHPRGRTVDKSTLDSEGYDTSRLPQPALAHI